MHKVPTGTRRVNRDGKHPPQEWTIMFTPAARGWDWWDGDAEVEVGYTQRRGRGHRAFPVGGTAWSDHSNWLEAVEALVGAWEATQRKTEAVTTEATEAVTAEEPSPPPEVEDDYMESPPGPGVPQLPDIDDLSWLTIPARPAPPED